MFGNKNSAVPYVRIGGVDRQSVLTSNANGNTPVKEIGVNANGNLIFSTDLTTFKSVLDLKYSQFKSNDENQDDTWETEKSVSMKATDGTSTTQLTVSPTGAKLTGALKISKGSNSGIQDYDGNNLFYTDNNDVLHIRNDNGTEIHLGSAFGEDIQIGGNKIHSYINVIGSSFTYNDDSVAVTDDIPTSLSQLSEDATHRVVTDTEKATWNAKSDFDGDYNSLTNKPTIPTNADFTLAGLKEKSYNSLTDKPTIPTKTSQLTNNSGYITSSAVPTKLSQLTNDKSFISSAGYISCAQSRNWGMGYIDYALSDGHKLRHEFGQAWINDGVTFTNAYSTVLWCTATPDCSNDSQIQRFSIKSISKTSMSFNGGAGQLVRWEVWGII